MIGIPAENAEEYERLHAEGWPSVLERLRASHMTNYSIYRYGELLFSYLEYTGDDLDADNAAIAADVATQEWWAVAGRGRAAAGARAADSHRTKRR